ncbi:MFS general substrate transporter [Polyplosphaeria fusca]|uniref:MFS general substrate transporter n=1 Tax=Polyplosphaeria fusca TaxID=682080 RepID=A0A9P4UVH1_9PLEO|nr:MFS general substrate transporter [Polyplosphaeria fusca]
MMMAGKEDAKEQISDVTSHSDEGDDERRTLWQSIKKYRKVVGYTIALTSAILLYGYDNVVVGTVSGMPKFQQDFGEYASRDQKWTLPSSWLALWNVSSPLGAMLGALLGGWIQDRVGRRVALGTSSLLSAIAVAIMGSGMAMFPVFTLLGQLTGALVIYASLGEAKGYTMAFYSQWPFSFVPVLVALLMPESPAYLVRRRRRSEALEAQARLDPPGADTRAIVEGVARDVEHEEGTAKPSFAECFHKRNFRRTFIVMWVNSLTAIFGIPLLGKASYFLQIVGMGANSSIIFLILGIVLGLLANAVSVWVMSRVGRRPLILLSLGVSSVLWLSMGIVNCFTGAMVPWWTAIAMMLTIVVNGVGSWPASFAVAAETSSLTLRAKTQGIGWFVSALSSAASGMALPYIFNPDEGNLRGKIGFTYVGSCLLGLAISWLIIPEMKGRTVGEVDRMFELGLGAREFKGWRGEEVGRRQTSRTAWPWV